MKAIMGTSNSFAVGKEASVNGVTVQVPSRVSSREAMRLAGLDWQVETRPVFLENGMQISDFRSVVRTDNNEPLGMVKNSYEVLQNEECFDICDSVAGEGGAEFEAAGALNGGRTVFAIMRMPGEIVMPGDDVVEKKLLFITSHDGTSMTRMIPFMWRLFCANQFAGIIRKGRSEGVSVRHTRNAQMRLREASKMLGLANKYFDDFAAAAGQLQKRTIVEKEMQQFLQDMFPAKNEASVHTRTKNNRQALLELFLEGSGQHGNPNAYGTAWGAFNAVTEYVDHHRNTRTTNQEEREELRFKSAWFESGHAMKQKAFDLLVKKI